MSCKRKLWITLMLMAALCMGACEKNKENVAETNNPVQEQVDQTEQEGQKEQGDLDEKEQQREEEENQQQSQVSIPKILVTSDTKKWYTEDDMYLLLEIKESFVKVENEGFEVLNKALEEKFHGLEKEYKDGLLESAKEHQLQSVTEEYVNFSEYYSNETVSVTKCDSNMLSLFSFGEEYSGGAHGFYFAQGLNFDVKTGKELVISDILTDKEGFREAAIKYIGKQVYEEKGDELAPDYQDIIRKGFEEEKTLNWYMSAAGVYVIYNVYDLGPYVIGATQVLLPFEQFGKYMDSAYVKGNGEVITEVSGNQELKDYLGVKENVSIKVDYNQYDMVDVSIVYGKKEERVREFSAFCDGYLIKRENGRCFLVFTCDGMSDDYSSYVYEITNGNIKLCYELPDVALNHNVVSTDKIQFTVELNVLGTFRSPTNYQLDENGRLIREEKVFSIENAAEITVIKELPVVIEGKRTVVNPGENIRITGTNNRDEVYFVNPNTNETGTIQYEMDKEDTWVHLIDGVREDEYFEALYYVG